MNRSLKVALGVCVLWFGGRVLIHAGAQTPTNPGVEARVSALEKNLAALEIAVFPSNIDVDCDAGETVGAALAHVADRSGLVVITMSGTCHESVFLRRSNTRLQGATPGAGLVSPSATVPVLELGPDLHNVAINQLSLSGGSAGLSVGAATDLFVAESVITGNSGTGVSAVRAGSVVLINTTVTNNGFPGILANLGTNLRVRGGLVANNAGPGINLIGGIVAQLENIRVTGNSGPGVAVLDSVLFARNLLIDTNDGDGIVATVGSSVLLGESSIENNTRNGLALGDTSVARGGRIDSQIRNNLGWGILCAPSPAVAQIIGSLGTVTGNRSGDVSCPSSDRIAFPF